MDHVSVPVDGMQMFVIPFVLAMLILVPVAVVVIGKASERADAFEQVDLSPWLANFDEYSANAIDEGYRPIKPDESRTFYIRFVESQRARKRHRRLWRS
ncbi:hypothetical protein [Paenarthrobacter nicotinovorans]|uniref:hypothetical protein n=1 Tax=Paenarthrobacter nicotinovorans TaxID=29320 RepID=UPI003749435A